MSSRNRARRDANREARIEAEVAAHHHAVHRIWAIVLAVVLLVPAIAFAIARGASQGDHRVVLSSTPGQPQPSTVTVTSIVPVRVPAAGQTTATSIVTRVVSGPGASRYRTIPGLSGAAVTPVLQQPVTPQTVVKYVTAPPPTAPPLPAQKSCVRSTESVPGSGPVPVPVGPAPTKLTVRDLHVGNGPVVKAHTTLTVNYVAVACSTGKIIDASFKNGGSSTLKLDNVITGWQLGMPGARVGGTRLLGVPSWLAYGSAGRSPIIGPNEALWFEVQVLATDVTNGPPGAPTNLVATTTGQPSGSAKLSWLKPAENGASISQYTITSWNGDQKQGQQTVYTTASSIVISSLTPGKAYTFTMHATNSYGAGPESVHSNAVTIPAS